jgi:hypothetical protein
MVTLRLLIFVSNDLPNGDSYLKSNRFETTVASSGLQRYNAMQMLIYHVDSYSTAENENHFANHSRKFDEIYLTWEELISSSFDSFLLRPFSMRNHDVAPDVSSDVDSHKMERNVMNPFHPGFIKKYYSKESKIRILLLQWHEE